MEKIDVSYRLDGDELRTLVAQLVPHERPELPWQQQTPTVDSVRHLAMVCQLSEPLPGLIPSLTVRHHRASVGLHWRHGVFLRHPISAYASEALLELSPHRTGRRSSCSRRPTTSGGSTKPATASSRPTCADPPGYCGPGARTWSARKSTATS